jgi:hypothetical protein
LYSTFPTIRQTHYTYTRIHRRPMRADPILPNSWGRSFSSSGGYPLACITALSSGPPQLGSLRIAFISANRLAESSVAKYFIVIVTYHIPVCRVSLWPERCRLIIWSIRQRVGHCKAMIQNVGKGKAKLRMSDDVSNPT